MKKMQSIFRGLSALLCALLLGWYASPGVYRVLHLPDTVGPETQMTAPALRTDSSDALLVRENGLTNRRPVW